MSSADSDRCGVEYVMNDSDQDDADTLDTALDRGNLLVDFP